MLGRDDPQAVKAMIRSFYNQDYACEAFGIWDLSAHGNVFLVAEMYSILALKAAAKKKICVLMENRWVRQQAS